MLTQPYCYSGLNNAQILLIGHDPRLQSSDTQATYALFADYYFKPVSTQVSELRKLGLAKSAFGCIEYLLRDKFDSERLLVTNLCNNQLPASPKGKTVLIPRTEAQIGIDAIDLLLKSSNIQMIFAMSLQVNYWLHVLQFCQVNDSFITAAQPRSKGIAATQPYYEPSKSGAFELICGKRQRTRHSIPLYPILHVKNWPLKGKFLKYQEDYESCVVDSQQYLINSESKH